MSAVLDLPRTKKAKNVAFSAVKKIIALALEEEIPITLLSVSWETYEEILSERNGTRNPRFFYHNGNLLIMPTSLEHEAIIYFLELFINFVTVEWQINCTGFRSATFQREDLEDGFEPDSCFYFGENEAKMRGKKRFDGLQDPPPDLIIEVDITSPSDVRFETFALFGVPEIWRFYDEKMQILKLENGKYKIAEKSLALPLVVAEKLTEFIYESVNISRLEWIGKVKDWAKSVK